MYVSVNYFEDVYKIELLKGTEQGDYGIYSFTNMDSYNGTYNIHSYWHHSANLIQDGTEGFSAHGGQFYDGYLYLASNDADRNLIYRCNFREDGELNFDEIILERYDYNKVLEYQYIDGLCITNGYIYCSPLIIRGDYNNGDNKVVLKAKLQD